MSNIKIEMTLECGKVTVTRKDSKLILSAEDCGPNPVNIELDYTSLQILIDMIRQIAIPLEREHYNNSCSSPMVDSSHQMLKEIHAAVTIPQE